MIDDYSKSLLRNGIVEAKAGNKEIARRYLDRALYSSQNHDVMAEGWFWMSQVVDDPLEKRKALENCLAHDLQHTRARRMLAVLDGKLKADEIVDPDELSPASAGLNQVDAQRFMCPKCGGRMTFAPDGQSLICEYCSRNHKFSAQPGTANEKDFIIAMATLRGHSRPLNQQVIHCKGCGSEFILPPNQISSTCVYCGSPHVVNWESSEELLAPDGIIPHAFDQKRAGQLLMDWVKQNQITPEKQVSRLRGLYLPLWTFDLGGGIDYVGEMVEQEEISFNSRAPKTVRVTDRHPVQINDLPIPASRKLSAPFIRLIPTFELKAVKPYDSRYLADWPAEVYDIPLAEASLDARSQGLARYRRDLPGLLAPLQMISTSSANMTVESFRLDLLPVWMTEVWFDGKSHLALINGQKGHIASDLPDKSSKLTGGLMDFLADLLDD